MNEDSPARPRRLGLWIPWALFAVLAIGWVVYWNILRSEAQSRLEAWSQAQAAATGVDGFAQARASGFPLSLRFALTDAAYVAPAGGAQAQTPLAYLDINVVNPGHLILTAPEPVRYTLRDGAARVLTGDLVRASVRFEDETLARLSVETEELRVAAPDADAAEGVRAERLLVHVRPDPRNAADLQIAVDAQGLRLSAPVKAFEELGQTVDTLRLGIVATQAERLLGAPRTDPVGPWADAGGVARLEAAELSWGGVSATGTGSVTLDAARRYSGEVSLRLAEPRVLLAAIAASPETDPDASAALTELGPLVAAALERTDAVFVADDGELRLEARTPLGRIGPVRVRDLAPVYDSPSD